MRCRQPPRPPPARPDFLRLAVVTDRRTAGFPASLDLAGALTDDVRAAGLLVAGAGWSARMRVAGGAI